MSTFTRGEIEAAPLGSLIVDEDGEVIAVKASTLDLNNWYAEFFGGWVGSQYLATHQGGRSWKIRYPSKEDPS